MQSFMFKFLLCCCCRYDVIASSTKPVIIPESPPTQIISTTENENRLKEENSTESDTCPICLDLILEDMFITSCKHVYHRNCLQGWLVKSSVCPLCRSPLPVMPNPNRPNETPIPISVPVSLGPDSAREIMRNVNRYITTNRLDYKMWKDSQPRTPAVYGIQNTNYNPYSLQTSLAYAPYP